MLFSAGRDELLLLLLALFLLFGVPLISWLAARRSARPSAASPRRSRAPSPGGGAP